MKYLNIKEKLNNLVIFSPNDLFLVDPDFRLPTLYDWESKGLVLKLRNDFYVFSDFDPSDKDYYLIANKIYSPSYLSLESALNHYGIIPELVAHITSITTNKTNSFKTIFGTYNYSTVKEALFFGYKVVEHIPHEVSIASLEKTVLDYLYLNSSINTTKDFEGLRWNKEVIKETLDFDLFKKYLIIFDNKTLQRRCSVLMDYLDA
jgi:predicted transcriptional regulator of viral defense system